MSRREYEMTKDQLRKMLDACKPVPAMYLSGGVPMFPSPQENANRAWASLGDELGFNPATVQPVPGKGHHFFTADPLPERSE
jgi:aromatic ring-opening dioxygenase catalytic subunit (LigB family)